MRFKPTSAKPDGRKNNGGARPGAGRKPRGKNKSTLEREEAARLIEQKTKTGIDIPMAKEVLEELMNEALTMARKYKPSEKKKPTDDQIKRFREWSALAALWAGRLAPFQSPTFRAVAITPPVPQRTPGAVITELLDAIDDESRSAPLQIGGPMPARVA